jgi:hypothetical protein
MYFKYETKIQHVLKSPLQNSKNFVEYIQETTGMIKKKCTWNLESSKPDSNPAWFNHLPSPNVSPFISTYLLRLLQGVKDTHAKHLAQYLAMTRSSINASYCPPSLLHTGLRTAMLV